MSSWVFKKIIQGLALDGFPTETFQKLTQRQAKLYFVEGVLKTQTHNNHTSDEILDGLQEIEDFYIDKYLKE